MTALTGMGRLSRLILRRDRVRLPLWIIVFVLLVIAAISGFTELLPTEQARQGYYTGTADTPAIIAMLGPVYSSDLGGLVAQRTGFLFVIVPLISLLTVIRHTRTEEEAGRRELLGATVVGRDAALSAALLVTCAADLALGVLIALGMMGQGLAASGAFAYGLGLALAGWVFAAVGALTAQLTESAAGARGIGLAALGLVYALRMAGDTSAGAGWSWWLSPIGWGQHMRAFGDERWWLLLLPLVTTAVLAGVAYPLAARRDLGAGVLPTRPGPAGATPLLGSPLGLAWRLHRGSLAGWAAGFVVIGVAYGGTADAVKQALAQSPELREVFARLGGGAAFADIFIVSIMSVLALMAAGYAIQAALRMRAEEAALRTEPVLGTAVSRLRWAASHLLFAALGPAVVLALGGVSAGLVYGASTGDMGRDLPRMLIAALVQLPAVWVLGAVAVLLFGLLPRYAAGAWVALGACLVLGQLGAILQLDQAILDVSPFTHTPRFPSVDLTVTPLAWLVGVAVVLAGIGLAGFRRRDVPVT